MAQPVDRPAATLPRALRLRTQRDFRRSYQRGRRAAGDWLTAVVYVRHDAAPGPRLGVSVSKEHGGSVRRNKIKRLLREAFRSVRHLLPATVDVVLIPRVRPDRVPLGALQTELPRLVDKALAKADRPRGRPRPRA